MLFILNFSTYEEIPKPSDVPVLFFVSDFMECCEFLIEIVDYFIWNCDPALLLTGLEEDYLTGTSIILEGLVIEFLLSPQKP